MMGKNSFIKFGLNDKSQAGVWQKQIPINFDLLTQVDSKCLQRNGVFCVSFRCYKSVCLILQE